MPDPTRIKWFKARCYRTHNFSSSTSFWLGQNKPGSVQCLKNLIDLIDLLDITFQITIPHFQWHSTVPLLHIKHTRSILYLKSKLAISYFYSLKIRFQEVSCPMASESIFLFLPTARSLQGPHPPMYGIWFSCLGEFNSHSSFKQGGV